MDEANIGQIINWLFAIFMLALLQSERLSDYINIAIDTITAYALANVELFFCIILISLANKSMNLIVQMQEPEHEKQKKQDGSIFERVFRWLPW